MASATVSGKVPVLDRTNPGDGPRETMTVADQDLPKQKVTAARPKTKRRGRWTRPFAFLRRILGHAVFSSLTRQILFFNLVALVVLVGGIMYLNQFREGLIDAKVESLLTQGEIIASAVSASAQVDTNSITIDPQKLLELQAGQSITPAPTMKTLNFPIDPEKVAPGAAAVDFTDAHARPHFRSRRQSHPRFALSLCARSGAAV